MYNVKVSTEKYRSGHNELHSKCSCRVTGTWVRIPSSPPLYKRNLGLAFCVCFFCSEDGITNKVYSATPLLRKRIYPYPPNPIFSNTLQTQFRLRLFAFVFLLRISYTSVVYFLIRNYNTTFGKNQSVIIFRKKLFYQKTNVLQRIKKDCGGIILRRNRRT